MQVKEDRDTIGQVFVRVNVNTRVQHQQMNQQQAINKYVELIKRSEKRKKSNKLPSPNTYSHPPFSLTHVIDNALFKKNVQQKIKTKFRQTKQDPFPLYPTLKTLVIDSTLQSQMRTTKRKFQLYQEEIEKKVTEDRLTDINNRPRVSESHNPSKRPVLEPQQFLPLEQTQSFLYRNSDHQEPPLLLHREPKPPHNKSQQHNAGRKLLQLDGSIFHFDKTSTLKPFFRNMFHNKDRPEKAEVYELLKTMSPFTVKSKLLAEELAENRINDLRAQLLRRAANQGTHELERKARRAVKSWGLGNLHKRERSSLVNLRVGTEEISGWEFTEA